MPDTDFAALHQKVRRIEIVSNRLVSERMAGEYHSVFKGQGIEFEEVRPYALGDDIRSIDWNVTARAGAPHVKRYREEREMTVFFVVDLSGSCHFGTRGAFKSDRMAEICAVLALSAIANNDRVGMLLATDRFEQIVPPRKGRRHVLRMVREVLAHRAEGVGTDLTGALEHLRHLLHRRAVVFLFSDFLADSYERPLSMVARRHDLIPVIVEDPMERELPPAGLLSLVDAETGQPALIDASDPSVRRWFAELAAKRRADRLAMLRRYEMTPLELRTDEPYEVRLIQYFQERQKRLH